MKVQELAKRPIVPLHEPVRVLKLSVQRTLTHKIVDWRGKERLGAPFRIEPRIRGDFNHRECAAVFNASHTRLGVAGISTCLTPFSCRASMIALITAGGAPTAPASPAPFTPSGLGLQGVLRVSNEIFKRLSARGIA